MEVNLPFLNEPWIWDGVKWCIILLFWMFLCFGLYRQSSRLNRLVANRQISGDIALVLRLLQERQTQLVIFVTLLMAVIFVNEWHPPATPSAAAPAAMLETPAHREAPSHPPAVDRFETILSKEKANTVLPFSEITEFNEQNSSKEAYIDLLKRRYEAWLITYYYLNKCSQVPAADLDTIRASLHKELGSAQANAADENNILLAASGSYSEMYSTTPCDGTHITATKTSYDANMQQIKPGDKGNPPSIAATPGHELPYSP